MRRLKGHRRSSSWYWEIANVTLETHKSIRHALFAEAVAIRDESPLYNLRRPVPVDPDAPPAPPPPPVVVEEETVDLKVSGPSANFLGESGPFVVAYTILPKARGARQHVERVAARFLDTRGFILSDISAPGNAMLMALKWALSVDATIITDRQAEFAPYATDIQKYGIRVESVSEFVR